MSSGGSYASVEKATTDIFATYFERYITDEKLVDRIKNDKNMIAEITDMISTECGATNVTLEGIVAQYVEKYSK
ncbi:MAG: hypothetical protein A2176_13100 [Spirochaetes bacterium RBG_13_51_14]|nr:MAG: hypothetical protein A2176_13100 [Spirochaetes bacterium RBG_13_51_14]